MNIAYRSQNGERCLISPESVFQLSIDYRTDAERAAVLGTSTASWREIWRKAQTAPGGEEFRAGVPGPDIGSPWL